MDAGGFVLNAVVAVLNGLRRFSIEYWVTRRIGAGRKNWAKRNRFIDAFVLVCLSSSILTYFALSGSRLLSWCSAIGWFVLFFALYRIADILTFLARQLLAGSENRGDEHSVASYERTLLFAFLNFLEIVMWFACAYVVFKSQGRLLVEQKIENVGLLPQAFVILRESFCMMGLNSTGAFKTVSRMVYSIFLLHSVAGLFMTIVMLSYAVGLLRSPKLDREVGH